MISGAQVLPELDTKTENDGYKFHVPGCKKTRYKLLIQVPIETVVGTVLQGIVITTCDCDKIKEVKPDEVG